MTKKLHHWVPRFYLKSWADSEGKLWCLQDITIRRSVLRNVAAQNYFYRLNELQPDDIHFIQAFIQNSPEGLKSSHERLLTNFILPFQLKSIADSPKARELISSLNEELHTLIEQDFQPCLAEMIAGSLSYLEDDKKAAKFYHALAVQYARTNHIKKQKL